MSGKQQAEDRGQARTEANRTTRREVSLAHQPHQGGCQRRRTCYEQFQLRVKSQRPIVFVNARAQKQSAQSKPAHEDGENRCRSSRGTAKDESKLPQPNGLIDERTQAGPEQEQSDQPWWRTSDLQMPCGTLFQMAHDIARLRGQIQTLSVPDCAPSRSVCARTKGRQGARDLSRSRGLQSTEGGDSVVTCRGATVERPRPGG